MRTAPSLGTAWHAAAGGEEAVSSEADRVTPKASERWFVYIALCADRTMYVGIARDVAHRIAAHNRGRGARYTRGRGPLRVLATRRCPTKGDALRLEMAIKRLARAEKTELASSRPKLAVFARSVAARARKSDPT